MFVNILGNEDFFMTMTKKVAVINDLSGLGRCSLTAAISVLSAMGIQTCPLPTAILSSQTEYPSYYCYDFTDKMDYFRQEWKKLGTCFSGIYTCLLYTSIGRFYPDFRNIFVPYLRTSCYFIMYYRFTACLLYTSRCV